jgi:hypothetical protein
MKKVLMMAVFMCATLSINAEPTFKEVVEEAFAKITEMVKQAPTSIVYGVTKSTTQSLTVNTPLGEYDVQKEDGGYRFLGLFVKLLSKKGSTYTIDSSIGKFKVDVKKRTITKVH